MLHVRVCALTLMRGLPRNFSDAYPIEAGFEAEKLSRECMLRIKLSAFLIKGIISESDRIYNIFEWVIDCERRCVDEDT